MKMREGRKETERTWVYLLFHIYLFFLVGLLAALPLCTSCEV